MREWSGLNNVVSFDDESFGLLNDGNGKMETLVDWCNEPGPFMTSR